MKHALPAPRALLTALLAVPAIAVAVLLAPAPASATQSTGPAVGFFSTDGYWIGSYGMADGSRGFCLQAGKQSPRGHDFDYVNGVDLSWFGADDQAKLAYIARTWAASDDPEVTAAGQLATWSIAGLGGHDQAWYAARARDHAPRVLSLAHDMLAEAQSAASRSVAAALVVSVPESGRATVRADLDVDRLGGAQRLGAGAHNGTVTLVGAVFEGGASSATVTNGRDYTIVPSGSEATVTVSARASFDNLPYGQNFTVAHKAGPVQNLLIAGPSSAGAVADTSRRAVSPLPFRPTVVTNTSSAVAATGAPIHDRLTVGVAEEDGLLPHWALYESEGQMKPVPVTIVSRLLGPFEAIEPADAPPADAPVVCTTRLTVTAPGDYATPTCTLPGPGSYVWVEAIAPDDTPATQGRARVHSWASAFGVATEVTVVPAPAPAPAPTPASTPAAAPALAETGGASFAPGALAAAAALSAGLSLVGAGIARARRRARLSS